MKKKLLVFHPIIAPYRIDLFNALAEHYDCEVVLYWRNLKDQTFDYPKLEDQMTIKPKYIIREELGTLNWIIALCRELRNESPDLVLVSEFGLNTIVTLLYRLLTFRKYRIISITDDSFDILSADNHFTGRHKKAINTMAPMIDEFINVEPKSTQWYQEHFQKGIYFPIIVNEKKSRERYNRILPISEKIVKHYGLEGCKVLIFVGRLVELKNMQMVIPAFKELEDSKLRFVLIGSGDYEGELKLLAKGDDRIIFVGRKEGDDLYAWYNVAQCFVLASYQEPFGAVTNEALLGGCWSLVSEKAGSHCLVENGRNGFTFSPDNILDFADKLKLSMDMQQPLTLPLTLRKNSMLCDFDNEFNRLVNCMDKSL